MAQPRGFFAKLVRLNGSEVVALAEALVLVVIAAPVIRHSPFPFLARLASRPIRRTVANEHERAIVIERITWAVAVAAKRSPLRALCFECGLAAQLMLRRRGVESRLYFGAAPNALKGLEAHVWVIAEGQDVSGGDVAALYAPLAVFPVDETDTPRQSNMRPVV